MTDRVFKSIDNLLHELANRLNDERKRYKKQCKAGGNDNQWNPRECFDAIENCNDVAQDALETERLAKAREMYLHIAVLALDAVAALDEKLV